MVRDEVVLQIMGLGFVFGAINSVQIQLELAGLLIAIFSPAYAMLIHNAVKVRMLDKKVEKLEKNKVDKVGE